MIVYDTIGTSESIELIDTCSLLQILTTILTISSLRLRSVNLLFNKRICMCVAHFVVSCYLCDQLDITVATSTCRVAPLKAAERVGLLHLN